MKCPIGPALLIACALAAAGPGPARAAAISYTLQDLGPLPGSSPALPGDIGVPPEWIYAAPQVDDSGAVHIGTGRTNAGGYSFSGQYTTSYQGPGSISESLSAPVGPNVTFPIYDYAEGINASGTAVGFSGWGKPAGPTNWAQLSAFVYRPGDSSPTGPPSGLSLVPGTVPGTFAWFALGVNASGLIVGQAPTTTAPFRNGTIADFSGHAFVSDAVTSMDLNTLISPGSGLVLSAATSINDRGQIAGYAINAAQQRIDTFLLTPTSAPEPGAWAVAAAALGYLGARRLKGMAPGMPGELALTAGGISPESVNPR